MKPYQFINIILASKHKKELAIRQPFAENFQANIWIPNDYDTDQFGTFSGEIPRVDTPYATVIKKATQAAEQYQFDYAIANEGSFGPHPSLFFAAAGTELICFIDRVNDIAVVESETTTTTNYRQLDIQPTDTFDHYLQAIKFPSHAVIVRCLETNIVLGKGINSITELNALLNTAFRTTNALRLETDMRAMMNPTRMQVIHQLSLKLVGRLQQICAQCATPGFGEIAYKGNLLCEACGSITPLHQFKVLTCLKCDYQQEHPRADGLKQADAKYCAYCNP